MLIITAISGLGASLLSFLGNCLLPFLVRPVLRVVWGADGALAAACYRAN